MAAAVANPAPTLFVAISSDTEEEEATERKDPGRNKRKKKKSTVMMMKKRRRRYSDMEIWTADEKEQDEDDCCILPLEPNGGIKLEKNAIVVDSDDPRQQDDDVSVLAERGKVACRDYLHPRHSCAKYPFHKTSHENCCSQCYCYVCDVSAPCSYWEGTTGHCHASIDDKKWGVKRQAFRLAKKNMLNPCSQVSTKITKIGQRTKEF